MATGTEVLPAGYAARLNDVARRKIDEAPRDERLGEAALPSLALVLVGLVPVIMLSRTLRSDTR